MIEWRIIVPSYRGQRVEGPWQRDVPFFLQQQVAVWIGREVSFTVEFR